MAIIKALILGKFVPDSYEHLKIGHSKKSAQALISSVLKKALLSPFLILLTAIEEVVVGFIHGECSRRLKGAGSGTRRKHLQRLCSCFCILIPVFCLSGDRDKLGEEELSETPVHRQPPYGKQSADALKGFGLRAAGAGNCVDLSNGSWLRTTSSRPREARAGIAKRQAIEFIRCR